MLWPISAFSGADHDLNVMRSNQICSTRHRRSCRPSRHPARKASGLRGRKAIRRPASRGAPAAFYEKDPVAGTGGGSAHRASATHPSRRDESSQWQQCWPTHFAPTERARENLLSEGVSAADVQSPATRASTRCTGSLKNREAHFEAVLPPAAAAAVGGRFLLLTTHRREKLRRAHARGLRRSATPAPRLPI